MPKVIRTSSANNDFQELVELLDRDLAVTDGDEHAFYDQFNKIDSINHVVLLYQDGKTVSCGALKEFSSGTMEVKRMFTRREYRGKGYAATVLNELEKWAKELEYSKCILETGVRQPDAIALYKKKGYDLIANYGQYAGVENSLCFGKAI
jgi:putative acetyltransferase